VTEDRLDEFFMSAKHNRQWDDAGNKLEKVAIEIKEPLKFPPSAWPGHIILWGHDRKGPFSILEGNHRMLAYAGANPRPPLNINVYVGISPSYCYWHYADPPFLLGNDLYKTAPQFVFENNWLQVDRTADRE
jgi:hypothetical protein